MPRSHNQHTTITFTSSGARPPVFVAGSFTVPKWQPCELDHKLIGQEKAKSQFSLTEQDYIFSKTFDIAEGQWQYKFRLGPGDWWVCDENAETGIDGGGNRNNILRVKHHPSSETHEEKHIHCKPYHDIEDTEHDRAWDTVKLDDQQGTPETGVSATKDGHKKHCPMSGHLNYSCSDSGPLASSTCNCGERILDNGDTAPTQDSVDIRPELPKSTSQQKSSQTADQVLSNTEHRSLRIPSISLNSITKHSLTSHPIIFEDDETERGLQGTNHETFSRGPNDAISLTDRNLVMQILPGNEKADQRSIDREDNAFYNHPSTVLHSPLFSHECQMPIDDSCDHNCSSPSHDNPPELPLVDLADDPRIEVFPTEPEQILRRIATAGSQLKEDITLERGIHSPFQVFDAEVQHSPIFSHERLSLSKLPSMEEPDHSIESLDGISEPLNHQFGATVSRFKSSNKGSLADSFTVMKQESDRDELEPLLKPEALSSRLQKNHVRANPETEGIRSRRIEGSTHAVENQDTVGNSEDTANWLTRLWRGIVNWFSSVLGTLYCEKEKA